MTDRNKCYPSIRKALVWANNYESKLKSFNLKGRGHEPRMTLSVRMAAIIRGLPIHYITIDGRGAINYYPTRVFESAVSYLEGKDTEAANIFRALCPYGIEGSRITGRNATKYRHY